MHPRIQAILDAPWANLPNVPNGWLGVDQVGPNGITRLSAYSVDEKEAIFVSSLTLAGAVRWAIMIGPEVPWAIVRAAVIAAVDES